MGNFFSSASKNSETTENKDKKDPMTESINSNDEVHNQMPFDPRSPNVNVPRTPIIVAPDGEVRVIK